MSLLKANTSLGHSNNTKDIGPVGRFDVGIGVAPLSFNIVIESINTANRGIVWSSCFSIDKDYSIFLIGELM